MLLLLRSKRLNVYFPPFCLSAFVSTTAHFLNCHLSFVIARQ